MSRTSSTPDSTPTAESTPKSTLAPESTSTSSTLPSTDTSSISMDFTDIEGSIDTAWQTRGTGRNYSSQSGHSTLIGKRSGQVVSYATRKKFCWKCLRGSKPHICRKNFERSAKAMEPDMAVELVCRNNVLQESKCRVGTLIGDDDSSYISAVRRNAPLPVKKVADINHSTKTLSNNLYKLTPKLDTKVIKYFKSMFGHALKQCKDDPGSLKIRLSAIVSHSFGDHDRCGDWCSYSKDPEGYVHKHLPKKQPLSDENLRSKLEALFQRFANKAEELAPCGSSQCNESFNKVVTCKHPKDKFYCGSESLDYRVAAAVCQKNRGTSYVMGVNAKLGLSPGSHTRLFRTRKDKARLKKIAVAKSIQGKRARNDRKRRKEASRIAAQQREGTTYESGCGFDGIAEMVDDPPTQQLDCSTAAVVLFDLETTGFRNSDEITQIAAKSGTKEFSKYILPTKPIRQCVTDVTGLSVSDGVLYLNGVRVETTPPRIVLTEFIDFLKSCGESCVLAAHNGTRFDAPFLLRFVKEFSLVPAFSSVVAGFSDTTSVLKAVLPQRAASKMSFSQRSLTEDLLDPSRLEGAHNALVDCCVLDKILIKAIVNSAQILHHSKTLQCLLFKNENLRKKMPLYEIVHQAGVSKLILGRIATHGTTMETLQKTYKENGERGISILMTADVDGKPRVTKSKSIIQKLVLAVKKTLTPPEIEPEKEFPLTSRRLHSSQLLKEESGCMLLVF